MISNKYLETINETITLIVSDLESHIEENIIPKIGNNNVTFVYNAGGIAVDGEVSDEAQQLITTFNKGFFNVNSLSSYTLNEDGSLTDTPIHKLLKIQPVKISKNNPDGIYQFAMNEKEQIVLVDEWDKCGKIHVLYSPSWGGYFKPSELKNMIPVSSNGSKTVKRDLGSIAEIVHKGNTVFTDEYFALCAIKDEDVLFYNLDDIKAINNGKLGISDHHDALIINKKTLKLTGANKLKNGDYGIGFALSTEDESYTDYAPKDDWVEICKFKSKS